MGGGEVGGLYLTARWPPVLCSVISMSHHRNKTKDVDPSGITRYRGSSRTRAKSGSTSHSRNIAGRRSPEVLFDSTPLYLPSSENVKTIEISINKCEENKKIHRKQTSKKSKQENRSKKYSVDDMSENWAATGADTDRASPDVGRRKEKGGGHYHNPRWD